jgi:predicted outer membrane repeat protein
MNMEVKSRVLSIFFVCCLISVCSAQSVSWISGIFRPAQWTIAPETPKDSDSISFSGPTGIFDSICHGRFFYGGTETITVNTANKVVELSFKGPAPTSCVETWPLQMVCGLQGSFGPLEPGDWVFKCTQRYLNFEIYFTVTDGGGDEKQTDFYVDKDAPGPVHDGKNWTTAFLTIQDALCLVVSGDTVRVAEGTYKPDKGGTATLGDRCATFNLTHGVSLIGSYAGYGQPDPNARDIQTYTTILSGDLKGDDILGILNKSDNSYHVVTACSGAARMNGFIITGGQADGASSYRSGGGLYVNNANPTIINCTFSGNTAGFGGAIACIKGSALFLNCTISGNKALVFGGGLYGDEAAIDLTNCLVTGNAAQQAQYIGSSAVYNLGSTMSITNCTVADNFAPKGMAITSLTWMSPVANYLVIKNSILYNGGDEIHTNHTETTSVFYSDIQGGWTGTGTGNIDAKPLFVSSGAWSAEGLWINGNYRLQSGSPCINDANNALLPKDAADLDGDGNTAELLPVDLDGAARIQQTIVDMGAYEQAGAIAVEPVQNEYSTGIVYYVPKGISNWPAVTLTGQASLSFTLNFQASLSVTITPASAAGGTWTASFDPAPGVVGPGIVSVTVHIRGENVDIAKLSPGLHKLADLKISITPAT